MIDCYIINDVMQCKNDEEIVAVIAHELGHWKLNHTVYTFIAMQVCATAFLNWKWIECLCNDYPWKIICAIHYVHLWTIYTTCYCAMHLM